MFKKCFCLFARWQFDPKSTRKSRLARHVKTCGSCQEFYQVIESLESDLKMTAPSADELVCQRIMREVRGMGSQSAPTPRESFRPHPAFALAALVVTALVAMVLLGPEKDLPSPPLTQQSEPIPPEEPPAEIGKGREEIPGSETILSVASLIEQQELIRRDAKKLGSHLRERVILFQSTD